MKTLYITDLDGTLLNNDAELTDITRKAINDAIRMGADFTVATARTFATVLDMFSGINLTLPIVLMNGVMIYDPVRRKTVVSRAISNKSAVKVLETFKMHGLSPLIYLDKGDCLEIEYCNSVNSFQSAYINKRNHSQGKMFKLSPAPEIRRNDRVIYFVTLDLYENISALYNDLKDIEDVNVAFYRDNYTDCYFLEIFAQGASKATGLSEVSKNVGADRVIAFGDNLNDIDMFKAADEAYAVSNACDELKEISTAVIGSNCDDSVAKFIINHLTENNHG